jgi:hypothetical protein
LLLFQLLLVVMVEHRLAAGAAATRLPLTA